MQYMTIGERAQLTALSPKALRLYGEPAYDALHRWARDHRRPQSGPLRQLLIGDQRTAQPDTQVVHLSPPLR